MALGSPSPTILIIDDEESILQLYETKLKDAGFAVLTAEDGYDGIDVARQEKPDLILLDVLMPGMSGTDVLLELKDDDATVDIPVFFLTAIQEKPEDEKAAKEAGAEGYLNKDADLEMLADTIQRFLNVPPAA